MQKLAEICIRRPVFASMIILSLVVVGAASYGQLGVDRFPPVDLPTVMVRASLPGAAPEEMESEVGIPLEEAVNTVQGISELRTIAGQGTAIVVVTFALDRDIDAATQDVRDRVAAALPNLPRDIDPPIVRKFDNDSSAVITIALTADRSVRELTEIADKTVRPFLERVSGVGDVTVDGGLERAIDVRIDVDRLAAYRIPITSVRTALQRQNAEIPGGNVDAGRREISLRTLGRFDDARAFQNLVVANVNGSPVKLRDIGTVEDGTKEQRSVSRLDGVPTVSLEVRRQSGANTIAVIDGIKESLRRVQAVLPADVKLLVIQDQSVYIENALHEINVHLILGSILASLVVLAFMRNARATLIAAVAIPASLVATFGMMRAFGFTLNSVTMLALVLMVGHRDRRRDRRAREHLPLRGREEDERVRGGARRDRGHRPRGAGDHLLAGRDLPAGVVHVLDLGPLPLPVRDHGLGGDPGEPAGELHAHADDERAAARGPRGARRAARRRGGLAPRLLPLARRALRAPARLEHAAPAPDGGVRRPRRALELPDLPVRAAGVHPGQRRRGRVRGERQRARGHEPERHGRGAARGRVGDQARRAASRACSPRRAAATWAASTRATSSCA